MKITKTKLKEIIREEIQKLDEGPIKSIKQLFDKFTGKEKKKEVTRQILKLFYDVLIKNNVVVETIETKKPKGIPEDKFIDQFDRKYKKYLKYIGYGSVGTLLDVFIAGGDIENKNGYWKPTSKFKRALKY